jgi:DNA recombination protein RmuC
VNDLSAKNYFVDHPDAVELVVLFLPAENLYVAAVENDPKLVDDALRGNVIICGPSLLIMLLKAASQLWRRAAIEEEAQKIRDCGDAIYKAACLFIDKYHELGTKIQQLEKVYNDAAGTLNGNLIPKSRRMGKFEAVASNKEIEGINPIKEDIRPFSSPEAKKLLPATTGKLPELSLGEFETAELTFAAGDQ